MILQCTECQKIYRGHETIDDRIVPHGEGGPAETEATSRGCL